MFLFRFEPPAVVTALNAPQLGTGPDRSSPVVYRLDMSDANAYFLAQRFTVEDKDVIYVANERTAKVLYVSEHTDRTRYHRHRRQERSTRSPVVL